MDEGLQVETTFVCIDRKGQGAEKVVPPKHADLPIGIGQVNRILASALAVPL